MIRWLKEKENGNVVLLTEMKEEYTNREFFEYWGQLTRDRELLKGEILSHKRQIENLEKQLEITKVQIDDLHKQAQESKARMNGRKG